MIAEQWEHIKDLFEQALERSQEERRSFLADLTRQDPLIAGEVAQLLQSYEEAGDFLVQPCSLALDFLEELAVEQYRFAPGEVLCGRFRIVALIGQGGMGEVYKAWDEELEDHVALKTLRLELSTHEHFTSRFRRETQLARKVTYPNVCRIFDSFKHALGDGTYISVLSMEFLQGETLADHLKVKGRLTVAEALPMAQQIIAGLSAIHAAGIVHRDLKPSNLLLIRNAPVSVTASGGESPKELEKNSNLNGTSFKIKITDFGIAGRLPDGLPTAAQTEASKLLGTPDYMAPEQLEHARASVQSDIYSLGLVLYEMVTGVKPFAGDSAWKRTTAEPPPPRKLASDLPENWNKTIACCLERNPVYRFQTAQAVLDSLEGDAASAKIPHKPLFVRLKRAGRSKAGVLAFFFLLAMALAAGVYRYIHQSPEIPPGTAVLVTDIAVPEPELSGITVALKSQLAQSAHFEVEEDSKIVDVLKQMNRNPGDPMDARTAREVAWRSGAPLVVSGSLRKRNQAYVLSMKVERVKYNPIFPTFSRMQDFTASSQSDLLNTIRNASSWAREVAGEPEADLSRQDRPVEDTTTSSWLALQRYGDAEKKYNAGDIPAALVFLREAINADPDFAKAHMRLADILISEQDYISGYAEWKNTFNLVVKHNLTNRENFRIRGQYYEDTGDYKQSEANFHEYSIHYPNDYLAWFYWGSALEALERHLEALKAFQTAARLRPSYFGSQAHLAMINLALERYQDAQINIDQVRSYGEQEWSIWLRSISLFLQGNHDEALRTLGALSLSRSEDWQSRSYLYTADLLAELNRFDDAARTLKAGMEFDSLHHRLSDQADKLIALAHLSLDNKDLNSARNFALLALELDNSPDRIVESGTLLARSGNSKAVHALLQTLESQPETTRISFVRLRLLGELAMSAGHYPEAIRYFQDATSYAVPREEQEYLARAFLAMHRYSESRAIYGGMAHKPALLLLYRSPIWPGLWADSLNGYFETSPDPDKDACNLLSRFIALNRRRSALLPLNSLEQRCTKPTH